VKLLANATRDTWLAGDFFGPNRPMVRATIQRIEVKTPGYDLAKVPDSHEKGYGTFATVLFGQPNRPVELPNIKSFRWSRSIDSDVASATMVLYNTAPVPLGQVPEDDFSLDYPGYYTHTRGETGNRWGDTKNGWQNLIVPDRLVRTWEGYGHNPELPPETDPAMYPSGVWLIDDVIYNPTGHLITLEMRDVGRTLLDHLLFPPVIPKALYPISFEKKVTTNKPKTVKVAGSGWRRPRWTTDSNQAYIGSGITDGGLPYVSTDGSVYGHHGRDAFDASTSTYWLSVGNKPNWSSAYEYLQGAVAGDVAAVRVHAWGGPYRMWISVYADGKWQGAKQIPYRARAVDTNADIRYVKAVTITKDDDLTVALPKTYTGVSAVRITFSRLYNSGLGRNYKHRAGVRDFEVSTTAAGTTTTTVPVTTGNISDYTDIIKWLLGWGGLYWPQGALAYLTRSDGTTVDVQPSPARDPLFPAGRVWADLETVGTAPEFKLGIELWDKKPIMEGIQYVKENLGYNFYIDEAGAAIWRSPNIFKRGNWVFADGAGNAGRTTGFVTIDERTTLLDLTPKLSSRNVKEKVFVSDTLGKVAAQASGYNPYPSGMRRLGGWTDQGFAKLSEAQVMADMITVRQAMQYRTNTMTIPGYPAIQVDDQVRIYERISGEHHLHYVRSISSEWDLESGKWTYQIETTWLGENPFTRKNWLLDPKVIKLNELTRAVLNDMSSDPQIPAGT
jgi:hypothetical protein